MYRFLLLVAWIRFVVAGINTASLPSITPAPILRRDTSTLGYYWGTTDGTQTWIPYTYDLGTATLVTHDGRIEVCDTDGCPDATCADNWMSYSSSSTWTSFYCGANDGYTCGTDSIYTDTADPSPLSYFWCNETIYSDVSVYIRTPTDTPAVTTPSDSSVSPTSSSHSSSSTSPSPSPSPNPAKSTPIGPIVGGVVGGIAVIGAIIITVIIVLRRGRSTRQQTSNQSVIPQNQTYVPSTQTYPDASVAPLPEKTGATTTTTYYQGTGGGPTSPPMSPPMSPAPQYASHYAPHDAGINELPESRM